MTSVPPNYKPYTPFGLRTEHFASYGKTGTGKSVDIERCANFFYERGYKIIDLNNSDGRLEGAFFSIPQQDIHLIDVLQDLPYSCPPRDYPTEVYFPQYGLDPVREYPALFKVFSIPLYDIQPIEFSILTSDELTTAQETLLLGSLEELKGDKTANLRTLAKKVEEVAERGYAYIEGMELKGFNKKSIPPVHRIIRYLYETKLVTSGNCSTCLDVAEIVKNNNMTVFCWDYLPSRGHKGRMLTDFCQYYFLRKLYDLKKTYATKRKMLIIIREAAVYFSKSSTDISNYLKDFVKQARGMEVSLYFDTQTPAKIPYEVNAQIEEIFIHRMTSEQDIEVLKKSHSAKLTHDLLKDIQNLDAGQVIWLTPHKESAVKSTMPPPRSHHRREGESFEVLWKELNKPMRKLTELQDIYKEFRTLEQQSRTEVPTKKKKGKKAKDDEDEEPEEEVRFEESNESEEEEADDLEEGEAVASAPKPYIKKIIPEPSATPKKVTEEKEESPIETEQPESPKKVLLPNHKLDSEL